MTKQTRFFSSLPRKMLRFVKFILLKLGYFFVDSYEALFNLRDDLTPPKGLIFVGDGDFKKTGQEFLAYFIRLGALKPTDRVLDVGCGIGRMAVPLTTYLSAGGSYDGFDIVAKGIRWCTQTISPRFPNFRFHLADVANTRYYRSGKIKGSEYKFPFKDKSFDFIFLTSVFTHLLPADMENYLSEISRVLDKGRCLATFFLLNETSTALIKSRQKGLSFKYALGDCCVEFEEAPESAVAYREEFVLNLLAKYNLHVVESIHYGSWCGRPHFLSFQDIIILEKK